MRQFTHRDPITTTFHMAGQTVPFVLGVCTLADPSQVQLDWLAWAISDGIVVEDRPEILDETPSHKKKTKPSKSTAKKKSG